MPLIVEKINIMVNRGWFHIILGLGFIVLLVLYRHRNRNCLIASLESMKFPLFFFDFLVQQIFVHSLSSFDMNTDNG